MTAAAAPVKQAFIALSKHCVACPRCKVDPDHPREKDECPDAATLYRAWFGLWREGATR